MRFLVAGIGAIGSAFGGMLRKAGNEVWLLGRSNQVSVIKQQGLRISGLWGDHLVKGFHYLNLPIHCSETFDVILVTVKSYDTATLIRQLRSVIGEHTLLVSLQNGLGNLETIREMGRTAFVVGGRVIFGAMLPTVGEVRITVYTQPVMLGFPDMTTRHYSASFIERAQKTVHSINAAGIPCQFTNTIESFMWAKLLYNCALNPLSALHGVPYGVLAEKPEWKEIMEGVIREIFAVARKRQIPLTWDTPEAFLDLFYSKLLPDTYEHRSSMLQDIERGKQTEIDNLNGMVVRYGEEMKVATPINRELTHAIKMLKR
ncbi:MAG: hypothetical protein A2293_13545 [Elusimicrobia bacterium RIFOXYB2_FULL_49_7]|nr:MAG: hypothetical protein A2293_13545 [Elusimicrobia bacterium RIFOXYB2_FULL_49_7]